MGRGEFFVFSIFDGLDWIILGCGGVLCIVGCLVVCLVFIY